MTLNRWYVSGGRDPLLDTIEITDGVTTLRYVDDEQNLSTPAGLFVAAAFTLDDLETGAAGPQTLRAEIDNVDGAVVALALSARAARRRITVTRRKYLLPATTTPVLSYTMTVTGSSSGTTSATFTLAYRSPLELAWPRRTFNPNDFPGVRYA